MSRRQFMGALAAAGAAASVGGCSAGREQPAPRALPHPTAAALPRWRGFNLLEKFHLDRSDPFLESDFAWLAGWGFNFVRLPMSYRTWTEPEDPRAFREPTLRDIDQAIEWGRQYGVHVCVNFHRAPGYCVNNNPPEPASLWTDAGMQELCGLHWATFARRYRGIPNDRLSFNLVNEPGPIEGADYARVAKILVDAIRGEDPDRLIIADGSHWGTRPVPELLPLGIAQSTRGYEPMQVSHYRASWIGGSDTWPVPVWPIPGGLNQHLYGDGKPDLQAPLVLKVHCRQAAQLSLHIGHVSGGAELLVQADGVTVLQREFKPGPGVGEWEKSVIDRGGGYQADYDLTCTAPLPAGTREIQIGVGQGDWLTFTELRLDPYAGAPDGVVVIQPADRTWGIRQEAFVLDAHGRAMPVKERYRCSQAILQTRLIEPWRQLQATGVGVHVGEWGAYNQTPHAVVLAWMRDCLSNWQAAGWGWALWNLRGSFGILDSQRRDLAYETFQGHQLDRGMLELLRRF